MYVTLKQFAECVISWAIACEFIMKVIEYYAITVR